MIGKYNISAILLALFVFTIPYNIQVNNVALILLLIALFVQIGYKELFSELKKSPLSLVFAGLYGIYIVYAIASGFSEGELFNLDQKLLLLALPLVFAGMRKLALVDKAVQYLKVSFIASTLVCFALAYWDYRISGDYNEFLYLKLTDNLKFHSIEYSLFLAVLALLSLHSILNRGRNWLDVASLLLFSITILLLSVRGTILVYFSLALLYVLVHFILQKRYVIALSLPVLILLGGILAVNSIPPLKSRFYRALHSEKEMKEHGRLNGWSVRVIIWKNSWEIIKDHWLLGVGPSNVQEKLNEQYRKDPMASHPLKYGYGPHNQYVDMILSVGILGLLILLFIQGLSLFRAIRSKEMILMLIAVVLIVGPITEGVMELNKGLIFFIFFHLFIEYRYRRVGLAEIN